MKKILLSLARTPLGGEIVGWILTHMSSLLPVDRLRETDSLLAFWHPAPVYTTHILIVPKRRYRSLMALNTEDVTFMGDLFKTVKSLVEELELEDGGYRVVVNGGDYQEVEHLHFHLVAEE
ncbi:MAG: Purine nucleoside phosphoramidase [Chloroflexi bacterium]|nr:Purine nucleoside phosphoramidase [Chloroflexota bacterium]